MWFGQARVAMWFGRSRGYRRLDGRFGRLGGRSCLAGLLFLAQPPDLFLQPVEAVEQRYSRHEYQRDDDDE